MAGVKGKGGQKGRSGRKRKFDEEELLTLLSQAWPKPARLEAFKVLVERAVSGDLEALKLLMVYTYGKPKNMIEAPPEPPSVPLSILEAIEKIYGKKPV
ncbi:MAG TPA: hypothetical protein VLR90_11200 [Blastocatellia bacterium]|nr:hypothetical protein [Blastocatellia bacterium]